MARSERDKLSAPRVEEWIGGNHERADALPEESCEGGAEVVFGGRIHDLELQSERPCRLQSECRAPGPV